MWNFSRVFILLPFLVTRKFFMSFVGGMECLLSMSCINFDFQFMYLKSRKMLLKSCVERSIGLSNIYFYNSLGMPVGKHHSYCIY